MQGASEQAWAGETSQTTAPETEIDDNLTTRATAMDQRGGSSEHTTVIDSRDLSSDPSNPHDVVGGLSTPPTSIEQFFDSNETLGASSSTTPNPTTRPTLQESIQGIENWLNNPILALAPGEDPNLPTDADFGSLLNSRSLLRPTPAGEVPKAPHIRAEEEAKKRNRPGEGQITPPARKQKELQKNREAATRSRKNRKEQQKNLDETCLGLDQIQLHSSAEAEQLTEALIATLWEAINAANRDPCGRLAHDVLMTLRRGLPGRQPYPLDMWLALDMSRDNVSTEDLRGEFYRIAAGLQQNPSWACDLMPKPSPVNAYRAHHKEWRTLLPPGSCKYPCNIARLSSSVVGQRPVLPFTLLRHLTLVSRRWVPAAWPLAISDAFTAGLSSAAAAAALPISEYGTAAQIRAASNKGLEPF
jgi:hypothetical protein